MSSSENIVIEWIPVCNVEEPYVQSLAKFAVQKHAESAGGIWTYGKTYAAWYKKGDGDKIIYRLHLSAALNRVAFQDFMAIVLDQDCATGKIWKLELFELKIVN